MNKFILLQITSLIFSQQLQVDGNLKITLNKGQAKVKEKIENPGETTLGEKFKSSKLGKALKKFKNAETGSDLLKSE